MPARQHARIAAIAAAMIGLTGCAAGDPASVAHAASIANEPASPIALHPPPAAVLGWSAPLSAASPGRYYPPSVKINPF